MDRRQFKINATKCLEAVTELIFENFLSKSEKKSYKSVTGKKIFDERDKKNSKKRKNQQNIERILQFRANIKRNDGSEMLKKM